jgi:hypothetical protein
MCIICVDYQKQLLTADEAWRNVSEMVIDPEHQLEIMLMLEKDKMKQLEDDGLFPTKRPS